MKLNKDSFSMNKNMVEFDGKKVLAQPSQAESTKGKDVVIGEERPPKMIKLKSLKDGQWRKNKRGKPQQHPKATFDILMTKYKEGRADIRGHENRTIRNAKSNSFPGSGQHIYSRELVCQTISDSAVVKFRRPGSSSVRLLSGALLPDWATNAWSVGTSTDDIPTLSTLSRVVRTMGSVVNALPPGMVRTCCGFWLQRLLRRKQSLRMRRPLARQQDFET
jgi:hypothetical protein